MNNTGYIMVDRKDTGCRSLSCIVHHASGRYHASRSENGVTLVEMMIALVVLLLVTLAMMQTALVSIDANMTNVLRDEAVGIAEMRMNEARNLAYTSTTDNLSSDAGTLSGCPTGFPSTGVSVTRNLRNITDFNFCTNRTVTTLSTETKEIDITVGWIWKGNPYTHTISTILRRQ